MSYKSAFSESGSIENNYDPESRMGLMIADQAADESGSSDPLDLLMALEEELGCSIVQAVHRYRATLHLPRKG